MTGAAPRPRTQSRAHCEAAPGRTRPGPSRPPGHGPPRAQGSLRRPRGCSRQPRQPPAGPSPRFPDGKALRGPAREKSGRAWSRAGGSCPGCPRGRPSGPARSGSPRGGTSGASPGPGSAGRLTGRGAQPPARSAHRCLSPPPGLSSSCEGVRRRPGALPALSRRDLPGGALVGRRESRLTRLLALCEASRRCSHPQETPVAFAAIDRPH